MSANDNFEVPGLVAPDPNEEHDTLTELTYGVLDDSFYNILHDLVFETFRGEKMLRASSAAIMVEQKASQTDINDVDEYAPSSNNGQKVETAGATWENGAAHLKGNPLETTKEIRCQKCGLPRLLHPTDGNGGRKPDPSIRYCEKHPYINKPYHDVYGQTYVPEGPGRGKKKKDMINPLKQQKENTPNGSQDSEEEEKKNIAFPSSKCNNCGTHVVIKRMNNHMARCIGGFGRQSSRDAKTKMANGHGTGSQNGNTPPTSRNSTPAPTVSSKNGGTSPSKRDAGDDFDSEESPHKKKKLLKKISSSNKLKAPKMSKNPSQLSASGLSFESKPPPSDEEDIVDDGDDDRDGDFNEKSISVEVKKKNKALKPVKKLAKPKSKWLYGNSGSPGVPPDPQKLKIKTSSSGVNGHSKSVTRDPSESSQTLSSPN
ncbi:uncharacterized protein RSE6_12590 [Rhynchosporium secalis]|uniref:Transcriptional activator n=1 Tax=Rhynchosporium secalis TaxID=38038 RepID=A0A1E1MQR5_RHYSE|nr:uncharacterized protein RSE6_12590 [Rhynchosporium secalis]